MFTGTLETMTRPEAEAQAERLAQLQALVQRMTTDISKIDAVLPTFGPAEKSYRQSTELMRRGLSREQGILGSGQAAVSRSQLAIAINQASIQVDQIHTNWQNNYRNFAASYGQLAPQIRDFEQSCGASPPAVMPAEQDAWKSACARFADIDKPFQDRISSVKTAFGTSGPTSGLNRNRSSRRRAARKVELRDGDLARLVPQPIKLHFKGSARPT